MTIYVKPDWYFYSGRVWTNLTECEDCGAIGMYEQCHIVDSCSFCGGEVKEGLVGKWIKPEYKFWIFVKIKDGYWELKK